MKALRKIGACRQLDLTFLKHDERMRHFRQAHGGIAGLKVAVMMSLPLYVMPTIVDNGGTTVSVGVTKPPRLIPMRRLPRGLFFGN